MVFESTRPSRQRSSLHVRTHRSRSQSSTRTMDGRSVDGKGSSTQTTSKSKESEKRPRRSDSTAVSDLLLKEGGVKPLGKGIGSIPKHTPDKEYKVDYSQEPCPPHAFKVDQPSGCHLEGAPAKPKAT